MADIDALTLDVEDMIYGLPQIERPAWDTLSTLVTNGTDVEWRWTTEALHRRGDLWEYETSDGSVGEIILETEDHPSGADLTVVRARERTTAVAAGFAAGTIFRKNPQFPRVKIQRYLNEIIDGHLHPDVWIRSKRSLDLNDGRYYYPIATADYEVEMVYQADIDSVTLGAATYDETGGGIEDEWTLAGHGLVVGDEVRFSAIGGAATGYSAYQVYWVAEVPDANTFSLSATAGGSAIAGTGDSTGTWTLEKVNFRFDPLPRDAWEVVTNVADNFSNSFGTILRLKQFYDHTDNLYYVAKTKPQSSSVSSIPAGMADFIPYGAVWLLLGGTRVIPTRHDPMRAIPAGFNPSQLMADSRFFRDEFERRRAEYRRQLEADLYPDNYLRRNRVVRK